MYLLFCWTLVPAILSFFTALRLLAMSDKEFNAAYNRGITVVYS